MPSDDSHKLNKEQQEAVEFGSGPLLIIAGAGTGKTTVITERIKWLIDQKLARPEEILALTFTEKAAKEMEDRVDVALEYGTFGMWIMTFHSFCDRILRSEALSIGLSPHYKLMTETESFLLVKKNFWKFNLSYFRPQGNPYKFIDGMLQHFSRLKDEDISVEDYLRHSGEAGRGRVDSRIDSGPALPADRRGQNDEIKELANAYKVYEQLKIDNEVMDFGDLISNTLSLFRTRKKILEKYQKQFKYVLVDEFQDTNYAQNELVKLLAGKSGNVTVVADDDQSIYRFRGAAISNVLQFRRDFPSAKLVSLCMNYRSTQEILDKSHDFIEHNNPDRLEIKEKIDKKLISPSKAKGENIQVIHADRVENEAEEVVKEIKKLHDQEKFGWKDIAILVRANNHREPFVKAFERKNIPYQYLSPEKLFQQPEIKDLIAYLKVLADFTDSVSLYRVLSMNIFGFSQRDLVEILNKAKKLNIPLFEMMEEIVRHSGEPKATPESDSGRAEFIPPKAGLARMTEFVEMVHRHQELIPKETAGQILFRFLNESGMLKTIVDYKNADDEKIALNIARFFDKLKTFETGNTDNNVFSTVEFLNLAMDMGESPRAAETDWSENDAVSILTIHSAKGLEFPVVFLVNLIEGRFPTRERSEQIPIPEELIKESLPEGDFHLEEERRLFYVGMTRAKKLLYFFYADYYGEGKRIRKVSPFVQEALGSSGQVLVASQENKKQISLSEWSKPSSPEPRILAQKGASSAYNLEPVHVDYLSYSAIEAFNICPLHYKLRIIMKIPTPTTPSQSLGNSMHLTLRDFYSSKMTGGQNGSEKSKLFKLLEKNWIGEGYTDKKHREESLEKAKKFLTEYLQTDLCKKAKPIYLEQPFTFHISSHSGEPKATPESDSGQARMTSELKIGGKIDRIDDLGNGEVEIVDYKTGAKIPTQKEIDQNLQMTIYAIAASEFLQKPVEKIRLSFYYFDSQKKISTVRTKEQLEEAKKQLLAIRDEIQKSDFKCSGHKLCENCEFKMLCNG